MTAADGMISFLKPTGLWRSFWYTAIALFLLAACESLSAAPIVTIIDDDARSIKAIESVKSVADRHGIKVTFAAVASFLQKTPDVAVRLHQYEKEGHEVASHSLTHSAKIWKAGLSADLRKIEQEVSGAEAVFKEFGLHPQTFVYPYGNFPRSVRAGIFKIVRRYYPAAFNARGDINLPGKTYPLYISRHPMRKHNSMLMVKRLIDEASASDRSWVVILTHSANSDFSTAMLEEIICYAKKSGAVFLPASKAWQQASSWPQISEDRIPDYDRFGDYVNIAYFHLPYLLAAGAVGVVLAGGLIFLLIRRRRNKKRSLDNL
jgi:peptidoglycan/xylan/chitin deacetylase (PgdA/CDA1 family)